MGATREPSTREEHTRPQAGEAVAAGETANGKRIDVKKSPAPPFPERKPRTKKSRAETAKHWEVLCRRTRRGGRRAKHCRRRTDNPVIGLRTGLLIGAPTEMVNSITEVQDRVNETHGHGAPEGRAPQKATFEGIG